jgi:hypothetical protein
MINLITNQPAAPFTSGFFRIDRPFKTFNVTVRGAGPVSATAEIWYSPTNDPTEGTKIHTITASGTSKAMNFESSEVAGDGIWWAVLTQETGTSCDVQCGV